MGYGTRNLDPDRFASLNMLWLYESLPPSSFLYLDKPRARERKLQCGIRCEGVCPSSAPPMLHSALNGNVLRELSCFIRFPVECQIAARNPTINKVLRPKLRLALLSRAPRLFSKT